MKNTTEAALYCANCQIGLIRTCNKGKGNLVKFDYEDTVKVSSSV
jgi:hypothetical protein